MSKLFLIASIALFTISCSNPESKTCEDFTSTTCTNEILSAKDFKAKFDLGNVQIIDVRTANEFKNGKIENAKNIDINSSDFEAQIEKLDKTKPVLVYCASGGRSGEAASIMNSKGFQEIYDLGGGFNAWPY